MTEHTGRGGAREEKSFKPHIRAHVPLRNGAKKGENKSGEQPQRGDSSPSARTCRCTLKQLEGRMQRLLAAAPSLLTTQPFSHYPPLPRARKYQNRIMLKKRIACPCPRLGTQSLLNTQTCTHILRRRAWRPLTCAQSFNGQRRQHKSPKAHAKRERYMHAHGQHHTGSSRLYLSSVLLL